MAVLHRAMGANVIAIAGGAWSALYGVSGGITSGLIGP